MDFFKLLHGFVKIDTWISLSCYVDLSKLLNVFVNFVTQIFRCASISWFQVVSQSVIDVFRLAHLRVFQSFFFMYFRSLPNKAKLKFDQDFKGCWMSQSTQCPVCLWQCFLCLSLLFLLFAYSLLALLLTPLLAQPSVHGHGQLPSAYSKQILIMCNCPNATSERLMFANDIFAANEHRFYYHYCHSSTANVAQRAILIPERAAEGKIVKASLRFPFGRNLPHTFASNKLLAWGIQWHFVLREVFLGHPTLIFLSFMVLETNKF